MQYREVRAHGDLKEVHGIVRLVCLVSERKEVTIFNCNRYSFSQRRSRKVLAAQAGLEIDASESTYLIACEKDPAEIVVHRITKDKTKHPFFEIAPVRPFFRN